jgi:hypothetical protein
MYSCMMEEIRISIQKNGSNKYISNTHGGGKILLVFYMKITLSSMLYNAFWLKDCMIMYLIDLAELV